MVKFYYCCSGLSNIQSRHVYVYVYQVKLNCQSKSSKILALIIEAY